MKRLEIDQDLCVGHGNCVMTAEEYFEQGDDGIVQILQREVKPEDEELVAEAVKLCPASALRLVE